MNVTAPVKQIDLNESGRVLATLNDWRSILFSELLIIGALILLVVGLITVIVWLAGKRSANDQATLATLKESTVASASTAAALRSVEMIVSRIESERRA